MTKKMFYHIKTFQMKFGDSTSTLNTIFICNLNINLLLNIKLNLLMNTC